MGEIDDPHHAEHQRQAAGDQRVIAAEQRALHDLIEPDHDGCLPAVLSRRPKYAAVICSRVASLAARSRTMRPSSMQQTRVATLRARD